MVFEKDVDRLSQYLGIKPGELIDKYLFLDQDGTYAMRQTPCPFLGKIIIVQFTREDLKLVGNFHI